MKNHIMLLFSILLCLFLSSGANTQDVLSWEWQNSTPQGNDLYDIHVFDRNTISIVGATGTLLHTSDGGEIWEIQHHSAGKGWELYSVNFLNELQGWAVGNNTAVVKTTDGGQTWSRVTSGTGDFPYNEFYDTHFLDEQTGYVIYHNAKFGSEYMILKTTNGGSSWHNSIMQLNSRPHSMFFYDKHTGWVCGRNGSVVKTIDGGENWDELDTGISEHLYDIYFISELIGWAVGSSGVVVHTQDGGETWTAQETNTNNLLQSVYIVDENFGGTVGDEGTILTTDDGGQSWVERPVGTDYRIRAVGFADVEVGWAVGDNGIILHTVDGGETWNNLRAGLDVELRSVDFIDNEIGWAVGLNGSVLSTIDGGESWLYHNDFNSEDLYAVDFFDDDYGWIVGANGTAYNTNDGGINWDLVDIDSEVDLLNLKFVSPDKGYIIGASGTILITHDGGSYWESNASGTDNDLLDIYFVTPEIGWVVGENETILKTSDGGNTWEHQSISISWGRHVSAVYFLNENDGFVTGGRGVYQTNDGGETWERAYVIVSTITAMQYTSDSAGWVTGRGHYGYPGEPWWSPVHRWKEEGSSHWFSEKIGTLHNMNDLCFPSEKYGWVVGEKGSILKVTTDGSPELFKGFRTSVNDKNGEENIPRRFALFQNYPNPFNAATTIRFSVPVEEFVLIEVYNALGQKIEILTSQVYKEGFYEVTWNASSNASGVYLYKMSAGEMIETKKMVYTK